LKTSALDEVLLDTILEVLKITAQRSVRMELSRSDTPMTGNTSGEGCLIVSEIARRWCPHKS
jgi:hypothetical protein